MLVVWIGHYVREGDIQHIVDHQESRPLEGAFHVRERSLCSSEREREELWRVVLVIAGMNVQRIHPQVVLVVLHHQSDHVKSTCRYIDKRRPEDPMMERSDPAVARS